jgi:O-antigen/teichoic acid export membrane protein
LRDKAALERLFDTACQALAVGVLPTAAMLILFSREILQVWTRSSVTASHTYLLVSLLTLGSTFLALQTVPYFLALGHGWTRLNFVLGVILVILVIPALIVAVHYLGAIGGALAWIAINVGSTPVYVHLLMRRLLPGREAHWYLRDNLPALLGAAPAIVVGRFLMPTHVSTVPEAAILVTIAAAAFAGACFATPIVRNAILTNVGFSRRVGVA